MNTELMKNPAEGESEGGDGASFRLEALGGVGLDSLPDAPSKPKIPAQVLLLVVLIVAGGAALLVMRKLGMGPFPASADPPNPMLEGRPAKRGDHLKVIRSLASTSVEQVPTEEVQKNPFVLPEDVRIPIKDPARPPTKAEPEDPAIERGRRAESFAGGLKLSLIMGGVARIGDETVREGDTIHFGEQDEDVLTVKEVRDKDRLVILAFGDKTFTISMDEKTEKKPGAKKPAGKK